MEGGIRLAPHPWAGSLDGVVCRHCRTVFNANQQTNSFDTGRLTRKNARLYLESTQCPQCENFMVDLRWYNQQTGQAWQEPVYPRVGARAKAPPEVDPAIAEDFNEASLVIGDSPKAAAALGRRCLQHVLRENAGVKKANLSKEIQQVLDEDRVPGYLANSLDAVRNIGNFASHPIKSEHSGEVVQVEPGEAEWILDTLETLFDFFYVQPAVIARKRAALNEKLKDAGKPTLK